ncbi:MAG: ATP-binding protein, partial [Candidatus Dormibacteraceae bacterium]
RNTGVGLAILEREAADWNPDRLEAEWSQQNEARNNYDAQRQAKTAELGRIERDLELMDGSAKGARADEIAAKELSAMVEDAEEYLRLYLAREALQSCIEEYRQANQTPVLSRAEEIFATITRGAFPQLVTDHDAKGNFVLRGQRANGSEVEVDAMSDGTCDELYLALRLASLERYATAGRAMPMLFDDIFTDFDGGRAQASLTVLEDMADRFQVIIFTHNEHLAEQARQALPADRVHCHELPAFFPQLQLDVTDSPIESRSDPMSRQSFRPRSNTGELICRDCGVTLPPPTGRGRPLVRCEDCRAQ